MTLDAHAAAQARVWQRLAHDALLDHGPGWWGLRRSNLAILAPKADLSTALGFALKHKLVCWGMFAYSGTEDVYVVPGPYMQL